MTLPQRPRREHTPEQQQQQPHKKIIHTSTPTPTDAPTTLPTITVISELEVAVVGGSVVISSSSGVELFGMGETRESNNKTMMQKPSSKQDCIHQRNTTKQKETVRKSKIFVYTSPVALT